VERGKKTSSDPAVIRYIRGPDLTAALVQPRKTFPLTLLYSVPSQTRKAVLRCYDCPAIEVALGGGFAPPAMMQGKRQLEKGNPSMGDLAKRRARTVGSDQRPTKVAAKSEKPDVFTLCLPRNPNRRAIVGGDMPRFDKQEFEETSAVIRSEDIQKLVRHSILVGRSPTGSGQSEVGRDGKVAGSRLFLFNVRLADPNVVPTLYWGLKARFNAQLPLRLNLVKEKGRVYVEFESGR
jgi:hypothetical protein